MVNTILMVHQVYTTASTRKTTPDLKHHEPPSFDSARSAPLRKIHKPRPEPNQTHPRNNERSKDPNPKKKQTRKSKNKKNRTGKSRGGRTGFGTPNSKRAVRGLTGSVSPVPQIFCSTPHRKRPAVFLNGSAHNISRRASPKCDRMMVS